jgi:hypothetical protein
MSLIFFSIGKLCLQNYKRRLQSQRCFLRYFPICKKESQYARSNGCIKQYVRNLFSELTKSYGVSIAGYVSVCVQIYCVGFRCFTTFFGLHGHLQVCMIFYFHMLEGFCFAAFFSFFHVVTLKMEQRSRILQAYENKIYYTLEDGYVHRNM